MRLKIDIKELKDLEKRLAKAPAMVQKVIDAEAQGSADDIWRYASKLTPVHNGQLRAGMFVEKEGPMKYAVGNNVDYAPYVEFGTGEKVFIRPEWEGFAKQFKGKTGEKWDGALDDIKEWCRKKGIDEKYAYPILVTILNEGIEANPFLYPAFKYGRKQFFEKIKKVADKFEL